MKIAIYLACIAMGTVLHYIVDALGLTYLLASLIANDDMIIILGAFFSSVLWIILEIAAVLIARKLCAIIHKQGEKSFDKRAHKSGTDAFEYAKQSAPQHVIERCDEMIKQSETAVVGYLKGVSDMGIIKKKQAEILIEGYSKLAQQLHQK